MNQADFDDAAGTFRFCSPLLPMLVCTKHIAEAHTLAKLLSRMLEQRTGSQVPVVIALAALLPELVKSLDTSDEREKANQAIERALDRANGCVCHSPVDESGPIVSARCPMHGDGQ